MFEQMVRAHLESDFSERSVKKITLEQYSEWEKNYCFDGLKSLRPGQSFCNQFGITDHILFYNALDSGSIAQYIKDTYLE